MVESWVSWGLQESPRTQKKQSLTLHVSTSQRFNEDDWDDEADELVERWTIIEPGMVCLALVTLWNSKS